MTDRAGIAGEGQGHSATWWDYDNDGWPDLEVANDFAAPDKLYHYNRDGSFTNVIDQVVPHMPSSSMGSDLGDVNNDGRIDFLVGDMAATTHQKNQRTMAASRSFNSDPPEKSPPAPHYMRRALYLRFDAGERNLRRLGLLHRVGRPASPATPKAIPCGSCGFAGPTG